MINLGTTCIDKITGFTGVATGRVEYITGCNQVLLAPFISPDGALRDPVWFDEQRLDADETAGRITLDNGATPGFCQQAPIK